MPNNIIYPVKALSGGDTQWIIKDGQGKYVCNTLCDNDEANAKFIATCINKALEKFLDNDEMKALKKAAEE